MLELLKVLIGISDNTQDSVLGFFLELARNNIMLYLNRNDLNEVSEEVILLLASYYYENRTRLGSKINSESQGDVSIKYNTYVTSIPEEFKGMLPLPRVGVIG